jgi:hypothetical protein
VEGRQCGIHHDLTRARTAGFHGSASAASGSSPHRGPGAGNPSMPEMAPSIIEGWWLSVPQDGHSPLPAPQQGHCPAADPLRCPLPDIARCAAQLVRRHREHKRVHRQLVLALQRPLRRPCRGAGAKVLSSDGPRMDDTLLLTRPLKRFKFWLYGTVTRSLDTNTFSTIKPLCIVSETLIDCSRMFYHVTCLFRCK